VDFHQGAGLIENRDGALYADVDAEDHSAPRHFQFYFTTRIPPGFAGDFGIKCAAIVRRRSWRKSMICRSLAMEAVLDEYDDQIFDAIKDNERDLIKALYIASAVIGLVSFLGFAQAIATRYNDAPFLPGAMQLREIPMSPPREGTPQ
jgi:hypothetical protein